MLKILKQVSFKYCNKAYVLIYCIVNLTFIANHVFTPIATKLVVDSVIDKNLHSTIFWSIINIFSVFIFLIQISILEYIQGKIYADNFCKVSEKLIHNSEYYARSQSEIDFELMLSQNYDIVKPYFFSVATGFIFSVVSIVSILSVMFYYFWQVGVVLVIAIPLGILLSKVGEDKVNALSEKSTECNNSIKLILLDKIKIANEELFLKHKQLSDKIIFGISKKFFKNKTNLEKQISITSNFLVYGFLNLLITGVFTASCFALFAGKITFGTLEALQLYISQLWTPIEEIISMIKQFKKDKPYIEEFIAALDVPLQKTIDEPIKTISIKNYSGLDKNGDELNVRACFNFACGNVYIICGNNGVGKSTFISSIMGLTQRYTGEIFINDKLLPHDTSYSTIRYNSADSYISEFGELSECANLSSGQTRFNQMKFNLSDDANVYIIDEPTNYLDESNKHKTLDLIKSKLTPNTMVLITTNDSAVKDYFNEAVIFELKHI